MEKKMKVYTVKFYREALFEMDICASSADEAEHLFQEGFISDNFRRVDGSEVVDEICSIDPCTESMKQIELLN